MHTYNSLNNSYLLYVNYSWIFYFPDQYQTIYQCFEHSINNIYSYYHVKSNKITSNIAFMKCAFSYESSMDESKWISLPKYFIYIYLSRDKHFNLFMLTV